MSHFSAPPPLEKIDFPATTRAFPGGRFSHKSFNTRLIYQASIGGTGAFRVRRLFIYFFHLLNCQQRAEKPSEKLISTPANGMFLSPLSLSKMFYKTFVFVALIYISNQSRRQSRRRKHTASGTRWLETRRGLFESLPRLITEQICSLPHIADRFLAVFCCRFFSLLIFFYSLNNQFLARE